jgi:biopolymer transport protein ExbD
MRIRDKTGEEEAPVNLMPLIDMVFLLLIFFLVATTFAQKERELGVQLPSTAVQPLSAPPKQVIINIMEDGTYRVDATPRSERELHDLLTRVARDQPDREVLVRADERSIHRYFAKVVSLCRRVGIGEAKVGYILEKPKLVTVQ